MRILVVEDDALLAEGLVNVLTRSGHAVEQVTTGDGADLILTDQVFDLVVLDLGLPNLDGFEVLRRLRSRRSSTNVLVLTARGAVEDRVLGLDLGADDYVVKPFSLKEFEARVRVLLRRILAPMASLSVAGMIVDIAARRIRVGDQPIDLTPREWALLELFLTRPGRVLSKEQIAERLFTLEDPLSANAIEVHISRLRTKIGAAGAHVRTVRGFGYMWERDDE